MKRSRTLSARARMRLSPTAVLAMLAALQMAVPASGAIAANRRTPPVAATMPLDLTMSNPGTQATANDSQVNALVGAPLSPPLATAQATSTDQGSQLVPSVRANPPLVPNIRQDVLKDHVFQLDLRTPF